MSSRSSRGPVVPITAPTPQVAKLYHQLKQSLRPFPDWTAIVPDIDLRRYFERVQLSQGSRMLHYYLGDYPDGPAVDRISDYLPTAPLVHLEAMYHYLREDESRTIVVHPETIRGSIVENLIAAIATEFDVSEGAATVSLPVRFARAASGCAGVTVPGESRIVSIDTPPQQAKEAAWLLIFGTPMRELELQFRRSYPELARADASRRQFPWLHETWQKYGRLPTDEERKEIAAAHGYIPWEGDPYHFVNWAWTQHRRLAHHDFAPYGLDANHWEFLVPSATNAAGR